MATKLGINRETLRAWVRQSEIDSGLRAGTSTADAQRIAPESLVHLWKAAFRDDATEIVSAIVKAAH